MDGGKNGFRVKPGMTMGGGNDTGDDWAEMIGEGGRDGWWENGFRIESGMTTFGG